MAKKDRQVGRLSSWLFILPSIVKKNRGKVLLSIVLLVMASATFLPRFTLNQSPTAFFDEDNQELMTYKWFKYLFGSDESVVVMLKPDNGDVFSISFLEKLRTLETNLSNARQKPNSSLDRITRVRSIISADELIGTDNSLTSGAFIGDKTLTQDLVDTLRTKAMSHPTWPGAFFSKDGNWAMMIIQTSYGSRVAEPVEQESHQNTTANVSSGFDFDDENGGDGESLLSVTVDDVPEMEESPMAQYVPFMDELFLVLDQSGFTLNENVFLAGNPRLLGFFGAIIIREIGMTGFLAVLVMWVVLTITFRSPSAFIWPTLNFLLSLIILFGLVGLTAVEMTFMVNIIIFLLLSVTIATSIHIMSSYTHLVAQGQQLEAALQTTYKKVGSAIVLAGITTALGLVSLCFVPIPAIRNFAIFGAIGVIISLCLNLILWPVLLSYWAPKIKVDHEKTSLLDRWLKNQYRRTLRFRYPIYAVFIALAVTSALGMNHLLINSNYVEMIREGHGFKEAYHLIDSQFGGTSTMEILIDTGTQEGVKSSRLLKDVESLSNKLKETFPLITNINDLTDVTKQSYKSLNEESADFYKIPDDDSVLSQVLFSFESADPDSRRLLVDDNWQILRIAVAMKTTGSYHFEEMMAKLEPIVESRISQPEGRQYQISYSGNIPLMMGLVQLISVSQIQSFAIALVVICGVMFLVFKSFRLGIIATIPNLFPLLVVMGYAGWAGIPLDSDTLLVVPIAMGIAVDDTIHFLLHFRSEIDEGVPFDEAIDNSIRKVGRAMFFTTVVLSLGFSVYLTSIYKPLNNFGVMSALAVSSALLADIFLLPPLLRFIFKLKGSQVRTIGFITIIGLGTLSTVDQAQANTNIKTGKDVAKLMLDRDQGNSQLSRTTIISCTFKEVNSVRKCSSSKRKKQFTAVSKLLSDGQFRKTLNLITSPSSDIGIAFLQQDFEKEKQDSLQWNYLPALRKVKQIISANQNEPRTGTLFGSEIAYEDIEKTFLDDYTYKLLGEEDIRGFKTWKLSSIPNKDRKPLTSYKRNIIWVDKKSYIPVQTEHYDLSDKLKKSFHTLKVEIIDNIHTSTRMVVVNHSSNRMTMLQSKGIKMNIKIPDGLLEERSLIDKGFRDKLLSQISN